MVCNIPAAQIEAIEGGVAVSRHTAVVGKPDRPSPDINSKIVEINFNPYWTVPVSIVRRDLIPKMQAEPDYLTSNHIRIFDLRGDELHALADQLVLAGGGELPLQAGSRRFQFARLDPHQFPEQGRRLHARHAVEEPVRRGLPLPFVGLRAGAERARTGELAAGRHAGLVAPGDRRGDQERRAQGRAGRQARCRCYWVYVTAWATPDGVTQFRDDIYNRDGLGQYALKPTTEL